MTGIRNNRGGEFFSSSVIVEKDRVSELEGKHFNLSGVYGINHFVSCTHQRLGPWGLNFATKRARPLSKVRSATIKA